ncbi:MFS general substrate transporter [Mycena galericulata]|nr:MFS general substrate transporter [Mycena galericulata]
MNPDDAQDTPLLSNQVDPDAGFGGKLGRRELERSLLFKLDIRMSILILIYILNYIDRNNAAAARLHGFERDLNLTGTQFASVLSILYVGYLLMQIPSNMFLNYIGRPSIYLPVCMISWGLLSVSTGFTTNFISVMYTRFFIGFTEAAFFPGAWFLISKWYTRRELSQRTALLSCGSLISNAFGSLIASGILDTMDDKWGYASWRWLFFIEGGMTVLVAFAAIFILPDFPETQNSWLSSAERALAQRRMAEDAGMDEDLDPKQGSIFGFVMAVSDWKIWFLAFTLTSIVLSLSFNAYFPTLAETMGYDKTLTLLLCAPPWFFATFVAFANSRHSDRAGERFWHIVTPLFLMAQSYSGFITYLSWASGTIRPAYKRAVALALINMISSFGNIAGSYIWPSAWGPGYRASYAISIFASTFGILLCFVFRQHLALLNAEAERREAEVDEPKGYRYLL